MIDVIAHRKSEPMNLFKIAYRVYRENSKEIYKAFGFRHLSDATQYYVHPDNESSSGTTTLCQPIGEAIILFATMLREFVSGRRIGDYYISPDRRTIFLEMEVPEC